jgi:hypothetical protein
MKGFSGTEWERSVGAKHCMSERRGARKRPLQKRQQPMQGPFRAAAFFASL